MFSTLLVIHFIIASVLTFKSEAENKFITFLMSFWILCGPILGTKYYTELISVPGLGFDFPPSRVVLISCLAYLLMTSSRQQRGDGNVRSSVSFEKYLYVFYLVLLIVLAVHLRDALTIGDLITTYAAWLAFLAMYFALKRSTDLGMMDVLVKSLLIFCAISVFVGIVQFFVAPNFLRLGDSRTAFGGHLRSVGILSSDSFQAYYSISALVITVLLVKRKLLKKLLIGLYAVGVLLTFHRMSWIIAMLCSLILYVRFVRMSAIRIVFSALGLGVAALIGSMVIEASDLGKSEVVQGRLGQTHTLDSRFELYQAALARIPKNPLAGIGGKNTEVFYWDMRLGGGEEGERITSGDKGGIHNLYINMAYFYGVPSSLLLILLFSSAIKFFGRIARLQECFMAPALMSLMFMLANLSNWIYPSADLGLVIAISFGSSIGLYERYYAKGEM